VATVERTIAFTGGGALPLAPIASVALALALRSGDPNSFAARLRAQRPPVIARVEERSVLIDLRTVAPEHDACVVAAIVAAA
jgi:L-seryl-tRNA(Ser) seleniumtransferase